jgi:hypothetical protein
MKCWSLDHVPSPIERSATRGRIALNFFDRARMDDHKMTYEDIILLLLYRNRSHLDDRRLPFAVCREGIRETEGISIAKVSSGVHDLEYSGLISCEKRYVETCRRPCMAYSLTPLGLLKARIIELSNLVRPTSIQVEEGRVNDMTLLQRRDHALREKVVSSKIRVEP